MSGGALDYAFRRVGSAADLIREHDNATTLHKAFAEHLSLVADALHDLEWELSDDYGKGDADKAIRAVLGG